MRVSLTISPEGAEAHPAAAAGWRRRLAWLTAGHRVGLLALLLVGLPVAWAGWSPHVALYLPASSGVWDTLPRIEEGLGAWAWVLPWCVMALGIYGVAWGGVGIARTRGILPGSAERVGWWWVLVPVLPLWWAPAWGALAMGSAVVATRWWEERHDLLAACALLVSAWIYPWMGWMALAWWVAALRDRAARLRSSWRWCAGAIPLLAAVAWAVETRPVWTLPLAEDAVARWPWEAALHLGQQGSGSSWLVLLALGAWIVALVFPKVPPASRWWVVLGVPLLLAFRQELLLPWWVAVSGVVPLLLSRLAERGSAWERVCWALAVTAWLGWMSLSTTA